MSEIDIAGAVSARWDTFGRGVTRPLEWRLAQLDGLTSFLDERFDATTEALRSDLQRPVFEAQASDIGGVRAEVSLLRKKLPKLIKPQRVRTPLKSQPSVTRFVREPWGVVLILPAWNYPVALSLVPLAGAIAGGNAAIIKPSELAPASSALLVEELPRYVDAEAIQIVEGGAETAQALLEHRFGHIHYTGSGRVGRIVMRAAAEHLTPVTLELGGKNPAYVHGDTNMAITARRIFWGRLFNGGQTCLSPDWVLVNKQAEAELIDQMVKWASKAYGPDPRQSPDLARMVSERHHRHVVGLLDGAGDIVYGGDHDEAGLYVGPTIVRDVPPDHPILQEEIFGPILPIVAVDGVDDAIQLINERPQPLASYVFTHDDAVVERITAETSSGSVVANQIFTQGFNWAAPVGGVGESGMGAYTGIHSFECFTHLKPVISSPVRPDVPFLYPPYAAWKGRLVQRLLR